jgi:serine/threonine protein kinase
MVTAYIPGPSLDEVVRTQGPLDQPALRALGAGLAEGFQAVHAPGLVHRDLKPGSVIMAEDGPRIIDFGIARAADAPSMTSSVVIMGTISFMSPEQVRGERLGPESDVFSLGSVLAFAATGHGPFDSATVPGSSIALPRRTVDLTAPLRAVPAKRALSVAGAPASSGIARQVRGSPGHVWRTVVTATMTASSPMTAAVTGGAALPPTASAAPPAAAPSAVAM